MTSNNTATNAQSNLRAPFAVSESGRWHTADGIEVCEGPAWHGRSPARRYVAQRLIGGRCAWGATREAAADAVRALAAE
jgi:hypothetical protein